MKKFLALLLSVAMLLIPMSAFAAAEIDEVIDYTANQITISDSFDAELAGRLATLVIVNPGKDLADFASDLEVICWADQCVLAADGSFSFVVDMSAAESADGYKFYVFVSGSDVSFEGEFDYDKNQIDIAYVEVINDCTLKSGMDNLIRTTLADRIEELDEDLINDYTNLKYETNVADKMLQHIPFDDMGDFVETLRDEVDAQKKKENKDKGGPGGNTTLVVQPEVINPAPVATNPFYDIADDFWGKDAIIGLYNKDIVTGAGDGYFRPNDTITRAEFVQMVVKAFGFGQQGEAVTFEDVASSDWFAKAVQIAYSNGVVNGTSATTFSPNSNITRQDMMVILTNAATAVGKPLTAGDVNFADAASIAPYAVDAVAKMTGSGIVYGVDGNVNPLANATRAEAAAMLARILNVK